LLASGLPSELTHQGRIDCGPGMRAALCFRSGDSLSLGWRMERSGYRLLG